MQNSGMNNALYSRCLLARPRDEREDNRQFRVGRPVHRTAEMQPLM
ncbi:MAG: hypothetical protein ONB48_13360 [candidate division KSB1 bacterium]|nr:hypothetical protein [candidate division KSB1 bacterium]MDZ7274912.1 hypothetical protein [candidate division KSB1 bacterium]MDZ7286636.1 hypothetical protein [candidate division KSB1 bacterium]MDZ7299201.1 hypothetical protein [candidate division KSB1 bacterium]MDZ7309164.1 hypothetical protein [candidate division KSB1 bacterium]